jgi:membrane protein required for colicin V production
VSLFFDFIILAIIAALAFMGARRGFIGEVFRFVAMIGGFFIAYLFYRDLQGVMGWLSSNKQFTAVISFLLIYVASFFAVVGLGLLLQKFIKLAMLGWLDALIGAILGVLKGALIAWVACLSISSMPFQRVQTEFGGSVVYKIYTALPKGMSLSGMESFKSAIRGKDKAKSGEAGEKAKPDKKNSEETDI